ncbi:BadF/BadG/BcrA/BcrD ATPase family protein, partial [Microbacterium sp. 13-71-7]|uniref:N-acetylglucosamine kinase n=1 Tax=Microbacterium sp. 13-71-7 TaxID=1970399 RepID=UPI000BD85B57
SEWIHDPLKENGFTGALTFESDLLAMYSSGAVAPVGYGVVCGTGASAVRVEGGRIVATADGLGWLLGDRGSGFWIGRGAAAAAIAELDGLGPESVLTPRVLQAAGIAGEGAHASGADGRPVALEHLIRVLYAQRPVQLSAFAPLVFDAAEERDPVAEGILREAGAQLVRTIGLVQADPGPVVIGGSIVLRPGPPQEMLRAHVAEAFGEVPFVLVDSGAAGATMLALRHSGVDVDERTLARVRAGIGEAMRAGAPAPIPASHPAVPEGDTP